jgi:hypothetical protein
LSHLIAHGLACGNDPDVIASPCIDHHQNSAKSIHPNGDMPLFTMLEILNRHGIGIFEDSECVGKGDAVFGLVFFGLGFIPFKLW